MLVAILALNVALADSPRKDALLGGGPMSTPRAPQESSAEVEEAQEDPSVKPAFWRFDCIGRPN